MPVSTISFFILRDIFTYAGRCQPAGVTQRHTEQDVEKAAQVFLRDAPTRVGGTKHEVIVYYLYVAHEFVASMAHKNDYGFNA